MQKRRGRTDRPTDGRTDRPKNVLPAAMTVAVVHFVDDLGIGERQELLSPDGKL